MLGLSKCQFLWLTFGKGLVIGYVLVFWLIDNAWSEESGTMPLCCKCNATTPGPHTMPAASSHDQNGDLKSGS